MVQVWREYATLRPWKPLGNQFSQTNFACVRA